MKPWNTYIVRNETWKIDIGTYGGSTELEAYQNALKDSSRSESTLPWVYMWDSIPRHISVTLTAKGYRGDGR